MPSRRKRRTVKVRVPEGKRFDDVSLDLLVRVEMVAAEGQNNYILWWFNAGRRQVERELLDARA